MKGTSPSKRASRNLISREQFHFDIDAHHGELLKSGLSLAAVAELALCISNEHHFLIHLRNVPLSKARTKKLSSFQRKLRDVQDGLSELRKQIWPQHGFELDYCGIHVQQASRELQEILNKKGKPGNVETDLDVLVYRVVEVLLRNGITPKRQGSQFNAILKVVFSVIGVDESAIESAVDKAWKNPLPDNRRIRSVAELIKWWGHYDDSLLEE